MSELSDLRTKVDRLSETAARTDANVVFIRDSLDYSLKDHEKRLRKVEGRQWWLAGVFAAIGAALGIGGYHGLKP